MGAIWTAEMMNGKAVWRGEPQINILRQGPTHHTDCLQLQQSRDHLEHGTLHQLFKAFGLGFPWKPI